MNYPKYYIATVMKSGEIFNSSIPSYQVKAWDLKSHKKEISKMLFNPDQIKEFQLIETLEGNEKVIKKASINDEDWTYVNSSEFYGSL